MPRNIDTTIFAADWPALEIRINELWEYVDVFVVCESNFTHSGYRKELLLSDNKEFISRYSPKLRVLKHVTKEPHKNARIQEQRQRQFITNYLKSIDLKKDDRIIHSDCDEIISPETIAQSRKLGSDLLVQLRNYTYFLNLRNGFWNRGRIVSGEKFISIQHMRRDIFLYELSQYRKSWIPFVRVPDFWTTKEKFLGIPQFVGSTPDLQLVEDSGWHFNNLMSNEGIARKIWWSSHVELANVERSDLNRISLARAEFVDVYHGEKFEVETEKNLLPNYVKRNIDQWKDYLI
jgi:beta-1,4-mannosyl-glycoprotein beta-1,4-N-acetylglucosaminyltransferase